MTVLDRLRAWMPRLTIRRVSSGADLPPSSSPYYEIRVLRDRLEAVEASKKEIIAELDWYQSQAAIYESRIIELQDPVNLLRSAQHARDEQRMVPPRQQQSTPPPLQR
jgi:hypothetical protein